MMNGSCDMDFVVPSVDDMINNSYYENGGNGDRHWIGQRPNNPRKRTYRNYDNQDNY
jgi:hypothetical protein